MATVNQYDTKVELTVSLVLPEDQARADKAREAFKPATSK